jgi:hypothetical protein
MKRAERVVERENNGLQHKIRRESEGGKNRDKKIVMIKLIKQVQQQQKVQFTGKVSGLIPLASNPGIGSWYSGLCGEGCHPSCQTTWGGDGWRVFFFSFSCFPWSYGPLVASGSPEVFSPDDWLVSSIWFLLSTGQVATGTCGNSAS